MQSLRDGLRIKGKITIDTYRAGMVEAVQPYLKKYREWNAVFIGSGDRDALAISQNAKVVIDRIKSEYHIRKAVECPNLIMGSAGYGLDIIIQRLVGINTYSLNINYGEIGTGNTAPTLLDTALTAPTNRATVGFQQDYGSTDAILQFFFSDSQLANQTYNEFGMFIDGTDTLGSGAIFNHALLSPGYAKSGGQDTTLQCDVSVSNS